ncbi:MAG TPA: peptidase MA family metallohydrolase [Chloroflexia bacterium]|nr:peptidase MA family metallohydrolase [Chloroflexia bacterium]
MMTSPAIPLTRRPWPRVALLILALITFCRPTVASAVSEQSITTRYFTVYYPEGEEQTAQWYAGFVDEVDTSVSELLGADPVEGITLRIYGSEADYEQANPMAGIHPGVMAHAIPEEREVGVAVERLRQQPPELARESFRHEMTHILAGALSNQNLPIAFQEGLAQYNELSTTRGSEVARSIEMAQSANVPLLSWTDLNIIDRFRRRLDLSYPQSYTVMAFLADRYGMEPFSRFLKQLETGMYYQDALYSAYGKPINALEAEWKEYLPGFVKEGYKLNVLSASDMSPALALYQAGKFKEAGELFARSETLFTGLGRTERASEATSNRLKADKAQAAVDLSNAARQALERHDYAASQRDALAASDSFAALQLTSWEERSKETQALAKRGLDAAAGLQRAKEHRASFRLAEAQDEARQAGQTFALLADNQQLAEANALLADVWSLQRAAGIGALGAGVAAVLAGALAVLRIAKRSRRLAPVALGEETASWL